MYSLISLKEEPHSLTDLKIILIMSLGLSAKNQATISILQEHQKV